ncbi:site-specific DNA-methyltransferase [Corynebacterium choanae]|uniref:Putative methyltransferase n=1 Tax=Corynebacterium choanae TaxID=1862358 RepID=A0A3G6JA79_9CORY|nr:site-specific DNA-methyltransferase [Corynebacterium choanae]AZA14722.1 putative methyltransferase [Corynebacterium choanae]
MPDLPAPLEEQSDTAAALLHVLASHAPAELRNDRGEVDPEALCCALEILAEQQSPTGEGYSFSWPGKQQAQQIASPAQLQQQSRLCRADGAAFQPATPLDHHALIVGDNLFGLAHYEHLTSEQPEVIYIDPPYNTGGSMVYADSFHDKRRARGTEPVGKHASWLSLMLPRLRLARDILADNGVIYVSIDDTEVAQLRLVMDELFGVRNHLATFVWETKRAARGVPPKHLVMTNHEYVLAYAKHASHFQFRGVEREIDGFHNPDEDPRGPWRSESMKATDRRSNVFTITDPVTGRRYTGNWAFTQETLTAMIADNRVVFPADPQGTPRQKKFFDSYRNPRKAFVTQLGWYSTEAATKALQRQFDGVRVFDFPKPQALLQFLLKQATDNGIVLDFFAGSGSTAEAVVACNAADGGNRRAVLMQQPEILPADAAARQLGLETISDITRARFERCLAVSNSDRSGTGAWPLQVYEITY